MRSCMHTLLLSIVFVFAHISVQAQTGFQVAIGGTNDDIGYSILIAPDGSYVVAGQTNSGGLGAGDAYLVKINTDGSLRWSKSFGANFLESGRCVKLLSDNGYVVTGKSPGTSNLKDNIYILRFSKSGQRLWSKYYGGAGDEVGKVVEVLPNDEMMILSPTDLGTGNMDILLLKLDSNGTFISSGVYGGVMDENPTTMVYKNGHGYVICGNRKNYQSDWQGLLVRIADNGNIIWSKEYGASGNDNLVNLIIDDNDDYVVTGFVEDIGAGGRDLLLMKVDSSGTILWSRIFGGNLNEIGRDLVQLPDGGYLISGITKSFGKGQNDIYILKVDRNGILQWSRTYGGTGNDVIRSQGPAMVKTSDGGIAMISTTDSYGAGNNDLFLIKFDSLYNAGLCNQSSANTQKDTAILSDSSVVLTKTTFSFVPLSLAFSFNLTHSSNLECCAIHPDAYGDTTVCEGDSVQLNVKDGVSFSWSPLAGLSCFNCKDPKAAPSDTTVYTVIVTDSAGCQGKATVVVNIKPKPDGAFSYTIKANRKVDFTNLSSLNQTWSWDFGDGNTSSIQNPSHSYSGSGNYKVCLITTNECGIDTFCLNIIVTGIRSLDNEFSISIIPNPVTDLCRIDFSSKPDIRSISIRLYDLMGKEYSIPIYKISSGSSSGLEFRTYNLPSGLYFVEILKSNNVIGRGKLVKISN